MKNPMTHIAEFLSSAGGIVAALGGFEFVKWLARRGTDRRVEEANAFKVERDALIEDYKRVQGEVDALKKKVDELYDKLHRLENERLDLIHENNDLRLKLAEAEKHVCLQPDDKCLQRLGTAVNCRLRDLLRGKYAEDHPDAILTEEDMKTEVEPEKEEKDDEEERDTRVSEQ